MALHRIIEYAKEAWTDDEGVIAEMLEPLPGSTTYDHDWDWVGDGAVQDCDVLMLYDMPQVWSLPSGFEIWGLQCFRVADLDWDWVGAGAVAAEDVLMVHIMPQVRPLWALGVCDLGAAGLRLWGGTGWGQGWWRLRMC